MSIVSEETLLKDFLNQCQLSQKYQSWRKKNINKYKDAILTFDLDQYEFEITISPDQWKVFKEWSETLDNNFEWQACFREFTGNGNYKDTYTQVLLTGEDIKTIFNEFEDRNVLAHCNPKLCSSVKVEWESGHEIDEFYKCSDSINLESESVGCQFVEMCSDWHYQNYREDHARIFNIENK